MDIKTIENSLSDYPDEISYIIGLGGCNFQCGYCHNVELSRDHKDTISIRDGWILEKLDHVKRTYKVDHVVVSGGEPTIHEDLPDFLVRLKDLELFVKLDTNGTNPEMLGYLIKRRLVDYVAMDIKTKFSSYRDLVGEVDTRNIATSTNLIMVSDIDYMFRTTVVPGFHDENFILWVSYQLEDAKCYQIQNFHNERKTLDSKFQEIKPFSKEELENFRRIAEPHFRKVIVRE